MPTLGNKSCNTPAVLWKCIGIDPYNEPILEQPVEIKVRWDSYATENKASDNTNIGKDATVKIYNTEVPIGSILWLGALADLPGTPTKLMRVIKFNSIPDVKNRPSTSPTARNVTVLTLMKYSNSLPAVLGTGTGSGIDNET